MDKKLLFEANQPVPKLTIRKLIIDGHDWLRIPINMDTAWRKYVTNFLRDPSANGWVDEIIEQERVDQLHFPRGLEIPKDIEDKIDIARIAARAKEKAAKESEEIVAERLDTSALEQAMEGMVLEEAVPSSSDITHFKGERQKSLQPVFIRGLSSFKQELLLVREGGIVNLSSLASKLAELKKTCTSEASMLQIQNIEEALADLDSVESEDIDDILSELEHLEKSNEMEDGFEHSEGLLNTARLEEENEQLRQRIIRLESTASSTELESELEMVKKQYQQLYLQMDKMHNDHVNQPMTKRVSEMEDKVKALREQNVQAKLELGKVVTKNQELERKLRVREDQIKSLNRKIDELMRNKKAV